MQARKAYRRRNRIRHWIYGTIIILVLLLVGSYAVIATGLRPINKANKEYGALVLKKDKLKTVDHFYWSARQKTYYTFVGKNDKNQSTGVIVEKGTKKMTTVKMADGLSYNAVETQIKDKYHPAEITNIGMSIYKDVPVWEVKFIDQKGTLNFITVQFSNGKEVRTIQNL